jgi:hypothetical protein
MADAALGGMLLGNGQGAIFWGNSDPNGLTGGNVFEVGEGNGLVVAVDSTPVGSIYIRFGTGLYVKSAMPNTWTQVTLP